jgi:hypothetical protein
MYWKDDDRYIANNIKNFVCLPIIISSSSNNNCREYTLQQKIKYYSKDYIEDNIRFFNPYLILIKDDIMSVMEHYYKISNHEIEFCGQKFPFYLFSEIEAHHDEVMDYANREYRGMKIPIKLTEKEVEELIYNEKSLDNEIQKSKTSVDRPF